MLTITQIKMARTGLRLSQGELAKRSGISLTAYQAIEAGASDPKTSTYRNIQAALENAGARFFSDGGVSLVSKSERFIVEPGQAPDAATRRAALAIVNNSRRLKGLPLLIDEEDEP